jgi:hypothetical protein
MKNVEDSLRLVLVALNELKQVAVLAAADRFGLQLFSLGVVKGKDHLEALLEAAGVDHYAVAYNQPFANTFRASVFEHSAKQVVAELEQGFRAADELRLQWDKGEALKDEEQSQLRLLPRTWMLWSSSVASDEGIERVRSWFKANKG